MWNIMCVECNGFNVVGFDIVFVNDGGVQVMCYIDSVGCNQVEVLWYCVQNWQWVGFLQFSRIDFDYLCFGRVVKDF